MEVSINEEGVVCKAGLSVISGAATPKQREGGLAVFDAAATEIRHQKSCEVAVIIFRCNLCRYLFSIAPFQLTSNNNTNKTNRKEPKD